MIIWIDAQLSPEIAVWFGRGFEVKAVPVRDLGLRDATDREIFDAAREAEAVVMTKDADYLDLVSRFGSPPQIIWITCGNTSNRVLKEILAKTFPQVEAILESGEPLIEIVG